MSKTIKFKVELEKNPEVYVSGYVEVNDELGEDCDWYFYDRNTFPQSQMFIEHLGIDGFKGSTFEQESEIDDFRNIYGENVGEISDIIVECEEDENYTTERYGLRIIINDGAKMECEIVPVRDYIVEVIPKFNGEQINLTDYMDEVYEEFDPWYAQDMSSVEDGHIFFEMSKEYFEEDDSVKSSLMEDVNEEARRIYARALTRELGVYSKYGEIVEQALDDYYDDEWLFKLSQLNDETLDNFLKDEGIIEE